MSKKNKLVGLLCAMIIGIVFILAVLAMLVVTGVISLDRNEIVIHTGSVEALYDGTPLTNHTWNYSGKLKEGHTIEVEFISSQTVVGESENAVELKIIDELGTEVTGDYSIKYDYGHLKVNPRIILVICEDTGNQVPREGEYYVSDLYDGLVRGHKVLIREDDRYVKPTDVDDDKFGESNVDSESESESENEPAELLWAAYVYDEKNNDVTSNYHIILNVKDEVPPEEMTGGGGGGGGGDGTGVGPGPGPGPIPLPPDTVLFSVYSEKKDTMYLKMQSHGNYDGQSWGEAKNYDAYISDTYSAAYLASFAMNAANAERNYVEITSFCNIYALPYYMSPLSEGYQIQTNDVIYSGDTANPYSLEYYLYNGDAVLPGSLTDYEGKYAKFVKNNYLEIDDTSLEFMDEIISSESFSADDPEIIEKVANYIQQAAEYNLKYDTALDEETNVAIAFLSEYKEGVCTHYATAATLLYRALNIPARYTVGAVAYLEADKTVTVTAKSAHAWVEVYIDGVGWRQVEVTGSDGSMMEPGPTDTSSGTEETTTESEETTTETEETTTETEETTTETEETTTETEETTTETEETTTETEETTTETEEIFPIYNVFSNEGDTIYLKESSLGDYTGRFSVPTAEKNDLIPGYDLPASYLATIAFMNGGANMKSVQIQSLCGSYGLPYYLYTGGSNDVQYSDSVMSGNASVIYSANYYDCNGTPYLSGDVAKFEEEYRKFVYSYYCQLPQATREHMEGIIAEQGFVWDKDADCATRMIVIDQVAAYISQAAKYNKDYDRALDSEPDMAIAFLEKYGEGVCRHYATAATVLFRAMGIPARYTVGAVATCEPGVWTEVTNEKAHAWVEVYLDGIGWIQVEVTGGDGGGFPNPSQNQITITPSKLQEQYTGSEIDVPNTAEIEGLPSGYTCEVVIKSISNTVPGKHITVVDKYIIRDPGGRIVNSKFNVTRNTGSLHIYRDTLYFESPSYIVKTDEGGVIIADESLTYGDSFDGGRYVSGQLEDGHYYRITSTANVNAGTRVNSFIVDIVDQSGKSVTSEYLIKKSEGTLVINTRSVTFRAKDATAVFDPDDPTLLTCNEIELVEGSLLLGHKVDLSVLKVNGSISKACPGEVDNIIDAATLIILDENGNDVTSNYSFNCENGKLTVSW